MDEMEFKIRLKGKIVLAGFSAAWCAPCRAMAPAIDALSCAYGDRVTVIKIDVDKEKKLAMTLMVHSIPTLILFDNGEEKQRFVGLQPGPEIEQGLNALLSTRPEPGATPDKGDTHGKMH